ncbi:carboxymuconolactone decarboxylase family protein [Silvimonas amylolytica]|uniref:Alkyl hydroperoxide reductase AhpD n=1 Tax=Silvimonas amylolytica TaxID=449663 RepID=A0ABQ2PS18_9NEIS|nr:carboxymuconolactone decarboxylase family protein [Silvimonas amylolytica]GGP28181.1 alkyl hydroperoxide reductase AhpD [Silvimonas amylolytica]
MTIINPVVPENAPDAVQTQLQAVGRAVGFVPNMYKVMANAPATLGGYLQLQGALMRSSLSAKAREAVALAVSQVNGCGYCLAGHSFAAGKVGLTQAEIASARNGELNAFTRLAQQIVETRGHVSAADLAEARAAGITDTQLIDVIGVAAQLTLTNYLNIIAQTEIDFPPVA